MRRVKLAKHIKLVGGGTPSKKKPEYWNGDIPWASVKDFNSSVLTNTVDRITKEGLKNSSSKLIKKGNLIIATRMAVGKAVMSEIDVAINQDLKAVYTSEDLDNRYLQYFFTANSDYFERTGKGATVKGIKLEDITNLEIPLPTLSEQKAIVAKLDHAQRLIDIDREMLAKYDELIQSVFLEMFGDPVRNEKGWETAKLGDLCGVGSSKRVYVKELVDEGIPFYRGQEIGKLSEGEVLKPELFVTEDHYQELIDHTGKPEIGDLLMPSICPDGRIYIVENEKKFYFKDGRVLWVKAGQSDINSFYLRYHLKALFQANYSEIASGTTFEELKIFALKKLQILNPPIEIQKAFQSEIEKINQDIDKTKLSLKISEVLFSSLVQGVFG